MRNVWGESLQISIFGESHGEGAGIVIGGLPAGFALDFDALKAEMARRAPGKDGLSTTRKEPDDAEILSGLFDGKTTGAPLCAFIRNTDTRSRDYEPMLPRPGHADYAAFLKYAGHADYRGGGHFSGRLTAPLVFAGAVAKQLLRKENIEIYGKIGSIYNIEDETADMKSFIEAAGKPFPVYNDARGEEMKAAILAAKNQGDSVGGVIEFAVVGVPGGLGEPFFSSVESRLSSMLFSIPAVKGVEFGGGFALAGMKGSKANDAMTAEGGKIRFLSNHNGGVTGGITTGEPIRFSVAVKPTPSIAKRQKTVDLTNNEAAEITVKGRHDPCIVPRAVPVVEAAAAICILDLCMMGK